MAALAVVALFQAALPGSVDAQARKDRHSARRPQKKKPVQPPCAAALDYQVLLDRIGFSPGQIDDRFGRNTRLAIRAFERANNLPATGPSCDTWNALRARQQADTLVPYTVTPEDVSGPFIPAIPDDMMEQAALPALAYTSPLEELGERFHVSPELLQEKLNPGIALQPGATIRVPNVTTGPPQIAGPVDSRAFTVEVTRRTSALVVRDADGRVVFFAPATVGSQHDPLPTGDWKVKGVSRNPVFHFNPTLFWDADASDAKATVPAGPNNPVGVVWIALDLPHYGIHGTPDPGLVGHSYSHGCVRLTNWDAEVVAALVRPGTVVHFR